MDVTQTQLDALHSRITSFMNVNYPCNCADGDDCPGETHEAYEIVLMVKETLGITVKDS